MNSYWYISRTMQYPKTNVLSVQHKLKHSVIELSRKATEEELLTCDLRIVGRGSYDDKHIVEALERYNRNMMKYKE
ncbi:hypothetical protein [Vagococcus lutrae]|uniref:hypothetical protein n=1 Tax=Vagococcus lutrae TaxID=81947 RepID=UPI0028914505|nr:hypothetical protein [Vagococcus lutrae]MDT2808368.1 hypothetical protein [Vagococcus lutrae]